MLPDLNISKVPIVALGAAVKATFSVTYHGNLFLSQYLGDLSDFDTQQRYHWLLQRTLRQFSVQPSVVVGDLHPNYFTTAFGRNLAEELNIPFTQIQHHEAHFAAILAERKLFDSPKPILGVIWDGTGYGSDGQIWGGEFFSYQSGKGIHRVGQLPYFPFLLGDKMVREPRLSALSFCKQFATSELEILSQKFSPTEWEWYLKLLASQQAIWTSSVGRLFDAVASLLGFADSVTYEGEAALMLETAARRYLRKNPTLDEGFFSRMNNQQTPFSLAWFGLLVEAVKEQVPADQLAALFHISLVEMVAAVAIEGGFEEIAFSGGVFQNALLLELLQKHLLPRKFKLYFHQALSSNDENIAFGQLFHHTILKVN
ncbi:MAG: carbamoyltransferase HypF [Saprospiraceae bacterium]|nr:carbamoyltransferase HypF [Saprospiraceae bacterium]